MAWESLERARRMDGGGPCSFPFVLRPRRLDPVYLHNKVSAINSAWKRWHERGEGGGEGSKGKREGEKGGGGGIRKGRGGGKERGEGWGAP